MQAIGIRTDNAALHGRHAFECGLMAAQGAKAPFRLRGVDFDCHSNCAHCGMEIATICWIKDANGKVFGVGTGCVKKTGDKGLYRAFTQSKEVRERNRDKRNNKDKAIIAEWNAITSDPASRAILEARTIPRFNYNTGKNEPETQLAALLRSWSYCGAAGRARYLKSVKEILAKNH